jgi:hypothetical protein
LASGQAGHGLERRQSIRGPHQHAARLRQKAQHLLLAAALCDLGLKRAGLLLKLGDVATLLVEPRRLVIGFRGAHMRVPIADLPERAHVLAVLERSQAIGAVEPERPAAGQVVPQLLQPYRGRLIACRVQQIHHFAVGADLGRFRTGQTIQQPAHHGVKQARVGLAIRHSTDHHLRQRLVSVERSEPSLLGRRLRIDAGGAQNAGDPAAVRVYGDDERAAAVGEAVL